MIYKHIRTLITGAILLAATAAISPGAVILLEGFDDISTLTGSGWLRVNNSAPIGPSAWFQGNGVLTAESGAADSYIAANFLNAADGGNISNWLILPSLVLQNGDSISFFTQGVASFPGDYLEVRMATNNGTDTGVNDTSVGDFNFQLTTIGASGYPTSWTLVTANITNLPVATAVRLALRYQVTDTSINGDYIGIDSLTVDAAVPEPSSLILSVAGGLALLGIQRLRRRESN